MPLRLSKDQAKERGEDIVALIEQDIRDRGTHVEKRKIVRDIYFNNSRRTPRYEGQADIHLPVLAEKVEGIVPKMMNAFWNADPHVHVRRVAEEFDEKETDTVERHLNWAVDIDIPEFYATTEMWTRNYLLDSVSFVKSWWNYETRNTVLVENVKVLWRAGEVDYTGQQLTEPRLKIPEEILMELFGSNESGKVLVDFRTIGEVPDIDIEAAITATSLQNLSFLVTFIDGRQLQEDVFVEFKPSKYVDEISVYIHRSIITKDNVEVEIVEYEDLIVPYRTSDIQTAERVTHQYWLTIPEIEQRKKSGEWDITDDELAKLKTIIVGKETQEEHQDNTSLKEQKDQVIGEHGKHNANTGPIRPYKTNKILVFEVYVKDDLNEDGEFEELIYHIPFSLKKIVNATYLEETFPHGRRPFADLRHIKISDRFYGYSIGEMLAPINVEVDAIINMVNEAQELINNPFFFYVPTSMPIDGEILSGGLEPGQGVPIGDINGVMFPQFQQQPLANLAALDSILLFADRLTISPQSSGSSQVRNAPRTARGTLALLSESGIKTDMLIVSAQKGGWKELMHQIHGLYAAFGPEERYFWVTGEPKPRSVSKNDMRHRFEFSFSGNTVNTNREVLRSLAQMRYQLLAPEPLFQMDLNARQALVKSLLQQYSEGIDVDKLLPKIPGQGGGHPPYDQKTELRMIINGSSLDALPTDDHATHMSEIVRFMGSKEGEMLESWQTALIAAHNNQHAQLLSLQSQQRVPGGETGSNMVPAGGDGSLGNFEGGEQ